MPKTDTRADVLSLIGNRLLRVIRSHPLRVAIDGVEGTGKTTFADELAVLVPA